MPQQFKTFQSFQNLDEYGNMIVPVDKMDELKRRRDLFLKLHVPMHFNLRDFP